MARRKQGDPKVGIGYIRVSTDDQRLGPDAQRDLIQAWAERAGVRIAEWFVDAGVSGGSELEDRPGLVAALAGLRAHRAGAFVVARRDRVARDAAVAAVIDRAVGSCGARSVTADGVGNGDGPAETMLRQILDAVAQFERAMIRMRTKEALRAKRVRGLVAGNVPYGYRLAPDGKRLECDEGERAVIARVLVARRAGLPLRTIVRELEGAGLVARSGKPLGLTQVARIAKTES